MAKYYYFQDEDLEHVQKIADNAPSTPHVREYSKIKPDGMSLQEIALEIGVSKQYVKQIINKALAKIRKRYRYSDQEKP